VKPKTQSFVLELPLSASVSEESTLLARLESARQVLNACLGESLRRLALLRQSKAFRAARAIPKGFERNLAFKKANEDHGFREYDLHAYAAQFGHSWIGEHLDSLTIQALASRVFRAAQRHAFGKAGRPRFKNYGQVDSVEGKNNSAGIRWRDGRIEWNGLSLRAMIDMEDPIVAHGLMHKVKYTRIVRRKLNGKDRFFAQLVLEGEPFRKPEHKIGNAVIGLDQGPSTIAAVSPEAGFALKETVCEELDARQAEIRRLQRKIDRQRRANNPDNYNPDGTFKKGRRTWKSSPRMRKTAARLREVRRRQSAHRKSLQGRKINGLLEVGNKFKVEKVSKKAWQRMFGRSVSHRAPGMFLDRLVHKAESAGGWANHFPTRTTRLSQVCHCGAEVRKRLSDRRHACPRCGIDCDRDLYSAFLASCVEDGRLDAGRAEKLWLGVDALLRAASSLWYQQAKGGRKPSHAVETRRQSLSPVESGTNCGEAHDVVVPLKGRERARAAETPGTPRL
jgi:transposase